MDHSASLTRQISRLSKCPPFALVGTESVSGSLNSPVEVIWTLTLGESHSALVYLKTQSVSFPLRKFSPLKPMAYFRL